MMTARLSAVAGSIRRVDRSAAALVGVLAAVAVLAPAQIAETLRFTLSSLIGIAPFLLLAVAVAGYTEAAGADRLIAKAFSGRLGVMIVAAALFGALSPFCSCGVIPLVGALLAMGVPLAAVMAFWLASPIMDPEMFVLTAAGLGIGLAVAKTVAAIAIGLFGGVATWALQRRGLFAAPLRGRVSGCAGSALRDPKPVQWAFWRDPARRRRFARFARDNALFLGKWLSLAFVLESLMLAWLPADAVGRWLGPDNGWAVAAAALVGAPVYLNGYAAIPTTGALMELGMTPGAALAFMTAGAVTSVPAAVAVYALVRAPVFLAYVALGLLGSTLVGYAYALGLSL